MAMKSPSGVLPPKPEANMGFCDQCGTVLHKTPWCSKRDGQYAFLCTPVCQEQYDNETSRIAWTQFRFPLDQEVTDKQ